MFSGTDLQQVTPLQEVSAIRVGWTKEKMSAGAEGLRVQTGGLGKIRQWQEVKGYPDFLGLEMPYITGQTHLLEIFPSNCHVTWG